MLKNYQERGLHRLNIFLQLLIAERETGGDTAAAWRCLRSRNEVGFLPEYLWEAGALQTVKPRKSRSLTPVSPSYISLRDLSGNDDGRGRDVPNVCFRVPTGGGKTLMAACAIEDINQTLCRRRNGLVLWVVPSDAIYRQTWKALTDRDHHVRQVLERASGGRVKPLTKDSFFSPSDLDSSLCVLLVTQASFNSRTKERRRFFGANGRYEAFFPSDIDMSKYQGFLQTAENLDAIEADMFGRTRAFGIIPSLANVVRIARPIVILDEAHKAKTVLARDTLKDMNPRFVLEVTATANTNRWESNVLFEAHGTDLKDEQMIKLPMRLWTKKGASWKEVLDKTKADLDDLDRQARGYCEETGRYIRPMSLIRVEATGKDQRGKGRIHAEDVREYLTKALGVLETQIRVKSSEKDEIESEDLLSDRCPVRFIITKDALREGWDCAFAYILSILDRSRSEQGVTQMIGRVIRQPHQRSTGIRDLDSCYVNSLHGDVEQLVGQVKSGLEKNEGLYGMGDYIETSHGAGRKARNIKPALRKTEPRHFWVPEVRYGSEDGRRLDYENDILALVNWSEIVGRIQIEKEAVKARAVKAATVEIDYATPELLSLFDVTYTETDAPDISLTDIARKVSDTIPNPWLAYRAAEECVRFLREEEGLASRAIATHQLLVAQEIEQQARRLADERAAELYRQKIKEGEFVVCLRSVEVETVANDFGDVDMPKPAASRVYERSLVETYQGTGLNSLERGVVRTIDSQDRVAWWVRIPAKKAIRLQGWRKNKVHPDFLVVCGDDTSRRMFFRYIETKGDHLARTDDTQYKNELFETINEILDQAFTSTQKDVRLAMVLQEKESGDLARALEPRTHGDGRKSA